MSARARQAALLEAMRERPGHRWRSGDAWRLLRAIAAPQRSTARHALRALHKAGHLAVGEDDQGRFYQLSETEAHHA